MAYIDWLTSKTYFTRLSRTEVKKKEKKKRKTVKDMRTFKVYPYYTYTSFLNSIGKNKLLNRKWRSIEIILLCIIYSIY